MLEPLVLRREPGGAARPPLAYGIADSARGRAPAFIRPSLLTQRKESGEGLRPAYAGLTPVVGKVNLLNEPFCS